MKGNKSSSPDGFTVKFYKNYTNPLMEHLVITCNSVSKSGHFPPSWKQVVVSVIPKDDVDLTPPFSYRYISLLNMDDKIFTAVLAARLNTFISECISPDQVGFIPGQDPIDTLTKPSTSINRHIQIKS